MGRSVDIIAAAALFLFLWPAIVGVQIVIAAEGDSARRRLRPLRLENLPLLWRVLQGRLTLGEWWRAIS